MPPAWRAQRAAAIGAGAGADRARPAAPLARRLHRRGLLRAVARMQQSGRSANWAVRVIPGKGAATLLPLRPGVKPAPSSGREKQMEFTITPEELERGHSAFEEHEYRDLFYRAATELISLAIGREGSKFPVEDALGVPS